MALEEADALYHTYVGTEHLLLGLIRDVDGVAARVLLRLGVDLDRVRSNVLIIIRWGDRILPRVDVGLTPRSRRVITLAVDEMFRLNDRHFGTEHLLLGLVREGEGIGGGVLNNLGVSLERVRSQVVRVSNRNVAGASGEVSREPPVGPSLDQLDIDLTAKAREGRLAPVSGRDQEIERLTQILSCRYRNSAVLLGEPGTGQMAVIQGLAQRIVSGFVPPQLQGMRLLLFHVGLLGAGTRSREEFEERLHTITEEIRANRNCIIVVEDIGLLVGPGPAKGAVDTACVLKPLVSSKEISCICAATVDEYQSILERDRALHRCFQPVLVPPRQTEAPKTKESDESTAHGNRVAARRRHKRDDARFAQFTTQFYWTLYLAEEEAQRLHHPYIGTEHLLLALIREGGGAGARVLQSLGVRLISARGAVEFVTRRCIRLAPEAGGLTPRARKVIEQAMDEARRLQHSYVGTEHLLLALAGESGGVGPGVLESLGVTLEEVRTRTMQVMYPAGAIGATGATGALGDPSGDQSAQLDS
jgi:ATP-dependent Clp protease ATP-binding subunit ClpA